MSQQLEKIIMFFLGFGDEPCIQRDMPIPLRPTNAGFNSTSHIVPWRKGEEKVFGAKRVLKSGVRS
jgi:hypothetical protein